VGGRHRRGALCVPTNAEVTRKVADILEAYPRLVMSGGRRNRADPFVIALAELQNATVVTGEGNDGNLSRPKIPFVCRERSIPRIRFTELIASEV
jgi:Domain of unknown function (DUF4411)